MPKPLFYIGTAFCVFVALCAAATVAQQIDGGPVVFIALRGAAMSNGSTAAWAIVVALLAAVAVAAILIRMAALLAARNLFGAFVAAASVCAAVLSLAWVVLLQVRMLALARRGLSIGNISEMHFAAVLMLGYFIALSLLALRPYFRVQASRFLSALVFFPLPLYLLIVMQELFLTTSAAPMPAPTPASVVFFAVVAMLFFSIAVHCVRHRHMFIEMTNLRELLEPRIDPTRGGRAIGGVAFDS